MQMSATEVEKLVSQVLSEMGRQNFKSSTSQSQTKAGFVPNEVFGEGGCEPFDLDYGMMDTNTPELQEPSPFARTNRILKRVHSIPETVSDERALLYTEAHKMYGGTGGSQIIKNAKILAHILKNVTINIYPDELIVGEMGCPARYAPIFPEFSYDWIEDELKNSPWENRKQDRFECSAQTKENLLGIADYWNGKNLKDQLLGVLTEEEIKGSSAGGRPVFFPNLYMYGGVGHTTADYETLLKLGYGGIKKSIVEHLSKIEDCTTKEGIEKREFYTAALISLEGATCLFKRYASLAAEMAENEINSEEKEILKTIASNCEWVSENPPRNFWEAMQLYHLATNIILIESNGHSISYGRFDQLLYPFYKKDMLENRITKSRVAEIIESFYIKIFELRKLRDEGTAVLNSEVGMGGTTLLVGGVDKDGKDATNDLTYLGIEAHAHTRLTDPWFASRWFAEAPWEFKVKLVNVIKIGTGQPKLFNDAAIIPASLAAGRSLEDARDYTMVGCVEIDSGGGKEYGAHDAAYFSLCKVLELAINNGRCIDCGSQCINWSKCGAVGLQLGPKTGSLDIFKSIEEVKESYELQMSYWVDRMATFINATELMHARTKPLPYLSTIKRGCIDNGLDCTAGGAIYNFVGPQGVGPGAVADAMCAIKQLIFDEKKVTGTEMLDALRKDWVGYEGLYNLINSDRVMHYGNDDDNADQYAVWGSNVYFDEVMKHQNTRNGKFLPGLYCVSANVGIGLCQGASPDGRRAYEAVSNSLAPVHTMVGTHDVKGPTAMANSAAKIDHLIAGNGTLLNVRFSPNCVAGDNGRNNFVSYIDAYFNKKAQHVQFNIVNTETLKAAQKNPEQYKGLLVRVAGYSAYFVKLSKELQDDLIGRKAYDSFD